MAQDRWPESPPQGTTETLLDLSRRKAHHGKRRFISPFRAHRPGLGALLRWKLFSPNPYRRAYRHEKILPVTVPWGQLASRQDLCVTFLNHACVMINEPDCRLLIDPVLFGLPWPIRDCTPLQDHSRNLPAPDATLITHGHYDHLDIPSLRQFNTRPVITPLGYGAQMHRAGVRHHTQLDWFESIEIQGSEITLLPSNHWTMRNPLVGPNTNLWGSYLVRTQSGPTIYLSGDTAWGDHFAEIGERWDIDLAIINLGAYDPRWFMRHAHLDPDEALQALRALRARKLFIVHWGTFRLGNEPVFQPPRDLHNIMNHAGSAEALIPLAHGQSITWNGSDWDQLIP